EVALLGLTSPLVAVGEYGESVAYRDAWQTSEVEFTEVVGCVPSGRRPDRVANIAEKAASMPEKPGPEVGHGLMRGRRCVGTLVQLQRPVHGLGIVDQRIHGGIQVIEMGLRQHLGSRHG